MATTGSRAPGLRARQAETTRQKLVEIARGSFAERGYAQTSIGDILERAGLARGGLYHHFRGKRALFEAVVDGVELEVLGWMSAASRLSGSPWSGLRAACGLYLSACTDPGVRRILLLDGPALLGSSRVHARRLDALRARLEAALDDAETAGMLAPLLLGALDAAAPLLGPGEDRGHWEHIHRSVTLVLEGLRLVQQQGAVPTPAGRSHWEEDPWQAWKTRGAATPKSSASSPT